MLRYNAYQYIYTMSKKKTIRGKGLWDFDTTPPSQLMTDRELAEYKRDGLPIPTYALDVPDAEMYANLYGTTTPMLAPAPAPAPKLVATSTSSSTPQLRISPDMYFLNPIPSPAERRAMELSMVVRDLEREVRELKQSTPKKNKKKSTPKKRKKKKTASKKRKKRSKSK
jgi:hypothetical protein